MLKRNFMRNAFGIPLHYVEDIYQKEFNTKLQIGNLRKCYLITLLCTIFTIPLMYLDRIREENGELDTFYGYAIFITHLIFFVFIPIAIYITWKRKTLFDASPFRIKFLVGFIILAFTFAMMPMAIFSIPDSGSILVYGIYIMIVNFVITIEHRWRLRINLLAIGIMVFSIFYFKKHDVLYSLVRTIECFGITIPAFAFATFHYNAKTKEFQNKKMLEAEQERSDKLLLNILPEQTARELKEKGSASPQFHEAATVLFTDFVGFSKQSMNIPPTQLVKLLNVYFKVFDSICKEHGLEKIKTIGDAYMAVSGVPQANENHATNAIKAAIAINDFVAQYKQNALISNALCFDIRIGVHSGSLVSGVVGTQKFAFDIWGNTVNTAARLEANSLPNKINISEATFFLIKHEFECVHRGKLEVKNMGEVEMYCVETP